MQRGKGSIGFGINYRLVTFVHIRRDAIYAGLSTVQDR